VTDSFQNAAAQSPLVTRYLKWAAYKGNIIETGNLIFSRISASKRKEKQEQLFTGIGGNKKVIVWAPSMKTRKSRRFYVLESSDELLSAMEEVFEVVSQMEDVHLIFRIHPGDAVTKDEIYSLLDVPANVSVSDSGAFEDVLAPADLLISFSSTALQEALVNHIPVLLYDKWNRYNHLDADRVEYPVPGKIASAYYINKKEYLASSIPWILEEHTKKDVTVEIFGKYVFLNDHFKNFIDFVEKCLNN
jgi:CDP-glycerol glycerophosphotransferase (TagB/SpsB family)